MNWYQRRIKVSTSVATVEEAMAFVLDQIESEGLEVPKIKITPFMVVTGDAVVDINDGTARIEDDDMELQFNVVVSGNLPLE